MKYHADHFLPILKAIDEEPKEAAGTFVILNDDDAVKNVLMNIINRFKYRALFVGTVDDLFKAMADYGVRFMLINLGTKNIDLNGLVRKFYASQAAHNIPVLAYKDMREGLFVHELVGGLNRLTRYILSLDELYSLLVDMLFRREIIPLVSSLKSCLILRQMRATMRRPSARCSSRVKEIFSTRRICLMTIPFHP